MKTKIKKRKNPNTPTIKENQISYLTTSIRDVFELITKKETQNRLQQASEEDIKLIIYQINNIYNTILNSVGLVRIR